MTNDQAEAEESSEVVDSSETLFVPPSAAETYARPQESSRRRLYISRTLQQLEDATKNWFTREIRTGSDSRPPRPKDAIDLFSLKYNESTVSTIATWVAGGSNRRRSTTKFHRPIVDTRFRSCSICDMYGHYEVECQSLTPDQMIKLSRILSGEASVTNEYSTMNIKHHDFDVLIENCDGFFIEQQSNDNYKVDTEKKFPKKILNGAAMPIRERQCVVKGREKNEMEIDGFHISEEPAVELSSNPETSFLQIPEPEPAPILPGSLVTWFRKESTNSNRFVTESIVVGTVAKIDADGGRVLVEVLRVTCSESKSVENYRVATENCSSLGARVWVCASLLFLVDEQNEVLYSKKKMSKASKKAEKPAVVKRPRTKKSEKILTKHNRTGRPNLDSEGLSKNVKRGRKPSMFLCELCYDVVFL
jgi:hypothetical protein